MSYQFTNYKAPYRTHVLPQSNLTTQLFHRVVSAALALISLVLVVVLVFTYSGTSLRHRNLYFLRVDLSQLTSTSLLDTPPSFYSSDNLALTVGNLTTSLGVSYFYQFGVSGYCKGQEPNFDEGSEPVFVLTECSSPFKPYWVDVPEVVNRDFVDSFTVDSTRYIGDSIEFPDNVVSYHNTAKHTMTAAWIMYVLSIAFLAIEILLACVPTLSVAMLQIGSLVSVVAFLMALLPAIIYTAVYRTIRNRINNDFEFGAFASTSNAALIITWLGVLFAWLSALSWLLSSTVGVRKQKFGQQQAPQPALDEHTFSEPPPEHTLNQARYNPETNSQNTYYQESYNQEPYDGQTYDEPPAYPMKPIK